MNQLPPRNTYHQFCNYMNESHISITENSGFTFYKNYLLLVLPAVIYTLHHCQTDGKNKVYNRVFKYFSQQCDLHYRYMDEEEYLESEFESEEAFEKLKELFLEFSEFALNDKPSFSDIENRFSKRIGRNCSYMLDYIEREYSTWFTMEF